VAHHFQNKVNTLPYENAELQLNNTAVELYSSQMIKRSNK